MRKDWRRGLSAGQGRVSEGRRRVQALWKRAAELPVGWKRAFAVSLAVAVCAAAALADTPEPEPEAGWLPRIADASAVIDPLGTAAPSGDGETVEKAPDGGVEAVEEAEAVEPEVTEEAEPTEQEAIEEEPDAAEETDAPEAKAEGLVQDTAEPVEEPSDAEEADAPEEEAVLMDTAAAAPGSDYQISAADAAWAFDPDHPENIPGSSDSASDTGSSDSASVTETAVTENTADNTQETVPAESETAETAGSGTTKTGTAGTGAAPVEDPRADVEALISGPQETDAPSIAGPDDSGVQEPEDLTDKQIKDAQKLEQLIQDVTTDPEAMDSLAFADVENLARTRNLTVLGLEETIAGLESLDYDKLRDNLRDALNAMSRGQDAMRTQISMLGRTEPLAAVAASASVSSLQSSYTSLYDQFDAINNGDLQRNNQDVARQLRSTMDQVVMGSETLYISLCALEIQEGALDRQLSALDRTVAELELRHSLGQISDLTLGEAKAGRSALVSGKDTLGMNLRTLKMQLENMLGAVPTGTLSLGDLPAVTQSQMDGMDVEADLLSAKEKSYELYAAARTLEDQEDAYQDAARSSHRNTRSAAYQQAVHTWNANQNTYNSTVRSFELRFRTLYEQVRDYYQVWNAARAALSQQNQSWQASQTKYRQGNISRNALLTEKDALTTAMEKVQTSANDLFSAYNNYRWAVEHGILN